MNVIDEEMRLSDALVAILAEIKWFGVILQAGYLAVHELFGINTTTARAQADPLYWTAMTCEIYGMLGEDPPVWTAEMQNDLKLWIKADSGTPEFRGPFGDFVGAVNPETFEWWLQLGTFDPSFECDALCYGCPDDAGFMGTLEEVLVQGSIRVSDYDGTFIQCEWIRPGGWFNKAAVEYPMCGEGVTEIEIDMRRGELPYPIVGEWAGENCPADYTTNLPEHRLFATVGQADGVDQGVVDGWRRYKFTFGSAKTLSHLLTLGDGYRGCPDDTPSGEKTNHFEYQIYSVNGVPL